LRRFTLLTIITAVLVVGFFLFETHPFQRQAAPPPVTENEAIKQTADQQLADTKIAEFPILKKQQQQLEKIRRARNAGLKGVIPERIKIPAIDVDATVQAKGELENGEMAVPADDHITGWYEPGYKPGSAGSSVIAGHVDSKKGPAVFFYLTNLKKGDEVHVIGKEGKELTFVVSEIHAYSAEEAPIRQIFGASDKPILNLITCTGTFDHDRQTHPDRLVVTTELQEKEPEIPPAPTKVKMSTNSLSWHAVRDERIIGYRVYKIRDNQKELITSVAAFERKSISIDDADAEYAVAAVNVDKTESNLAKAK
jgi:sortase A